MLTKQSPQLKADYDFCEKVIKKHSKSFYYTFKQLPEPKANAVFAIYAFCRFADNTVDQEGSLSNKIEKLSQLKYELELFEKGQELPSPLWRALRDVFNRYDMDIQPFYDQLKGQGMDLRFKSPENLVGLEQYSYYVAGTVGLMLIPIIASENHLHLKEVAVDLGIAMQITNILRDVFEDVQKYQRVYLPVDLMIEQHYTDEHVQTCTVNQSFINIWEYLATIAENKYDLFEKSLYQFDMDSKRQVLSAARVYRAILNVVRKNGYQCFGKNNKVSTAVIGEIIRTTQMDVAN
ncbi:phytoene synthase [Bacillus sp. TS-2]|nr:phytoene synthase [Bacillus sp. TS-2]